MRLVQNVLPAVAAVAAIAAIAGASPAHAADPVPEITRGAVTAQPVGVAHTLRQIPEACVRIEGVFTGDPAAPYRYAVVRTRPDCQPRARFVDAANAKPTVDGDWIFNDLLRVPSVECPSHQAVVRVWRKPVHQAMELDGQGQSRIYVGEAKQAAAAGRIAELPMYAAEMGVEGKACSR